MRHCVVWYKCNCVRFQVLTVAMLKTEVFQNVQLCCWVRE